MQVHIKLLLISFFKFKKQKENKIRLSKKRKKANVLIDCDPINLEGITQYKDK